MMSAPREFPARLLLASTLLFAIAIAPVPAFAAERAQSPQLAQAARAIEAAERGELDVAQAAALAANPLQGWIEYAALKRRLDVLPVAEADAFLARHRGEAVAGAFRADWLAALARRKDWSAYRAAWSPAIESTALRCYELQARLQTGAADARWTSDAQAVWTGSGKSLPDSCDPVFAALQERAGLTPALRWQRFDKAVAEGNVPVMRVAAKGLPGEQQALAEGYAAFMDAPSDAALQWPKTDRSRQVASLGLAKLAKDDPDRAEALLPGIATALGFTEADRGRVLYQVALWSAASYLPKAEARLAAVPATAWDERLHEWQVREALARSDWNDALAAIRRMPGSQRKDAHWSYFEARLLELTGGDKAAARAAYLQAAGQPEFHGFLAADRIDAPYTLCPWLPGETAAEKAAVAADPALARAMLLHRIDRTSWALREWQDALSRFDDARRRIAVEVALDNGWFDRAVFGLGRQPEEKRLYALRFPLHHADTIRREAAKNGLDPAWVAAEIRAESVFDPNARSPANARGLMQVVPATGAEEARRLGLPWHGAETLYDPDTNIAIGTAYLRKMLDRYGGEPYFAIAGYNAGQTPLLRWQQERPGMDPDFWIETISYGETRDYVARVLAFSTIYDWRLDGTAIPLTARMTGDTGPRKGFTCPLATTH
jgi:soluble lytic murein transglycosylase